METREKLDLKETKVLEEPQGYRAFKVSRDQQAFLVSQVSEVCQDHRGSRERMEKLVQMAKWERRGQRGAKVLKASLESLVLEA